MKGKAILLSIVAAKAIPILLPSDIVGVYSTIGGTEHIASGAATALLFVGSTLPRLAAGFAGGVLAGRAQRQGAA